MTRRPGITLSTSGFVAMNRRLCAERSPRLLMLGSSRFVSRLRFQCVCVSIRLTKSRSIKNSPLLSLISATSLREVGAVPRRRTSFSPRFDWQVNPNHTLVGQTRTCLQRRITLLQGKTQVRSHSGWRHSHILSALRWLSGQGEASHRTFNSEKRRIRSRMWAHSYRYNSGYLRVSE